MGSTPLAELREDNCFHRINKDTEALLWQGYYVYVQPHKKKTTEFSIGWH